MTETDMTETDMTEVETTVSDSADSRAAESDSVGSDSVGSDSVGSDSVGSDSSESTSTRGAPDEGTGKTRSVKNAELLVEEGDAAGDYLERLLDILDYDGDIDLDVEGERAVVSVVGGGDLEKLVGDRGAVLDALQELTRLAAAAETGIRSRLMLDIGGYRARRREELTMLGTDAAQRVLDSGEAERLAAMNPFERKIVHDAVGTVTGVTSSSEGEEPRRRVVVSPSS